MQRGTGGSRREPPDDAEARGTEAGAAARTATRKPYQRPVVEKKRSLRSAMLQSGGATATLLGGTGL